MALTKEQKKEIIENLKDRIDRQKMMVFVAVDNLKAKDLFDLRKRLKQSGCFLDVAKKTLMNIVFKEKGIKVEQDKLKGQIALIFGFEDELAPARITYIFNKENENLKILGGFFENEFVDAQKIIALAVIPSREVLLAKLAGSIKSPVSNFVNILQGNIRSLVYTLNAIKDKNNA